MIPDFGIGSGGHLNLFNMIALLEKRGYECRVVIDGACQFTDGNEARETIREHFYPIEAEVVIGRERMKPAWGTVATSWETAYTVRDFKGTMEKFYFVQDFEPYFYPHGSDYIFAENTYRFGFNGITVGSWLAGKLRSEYGMNVLSCYYSYNKTLYEP